MNLAHARMLSFDANLQPNAMRGIVVADETPMDIPAREALLDASFGPSRWLKTCERLRAGRTPARGLALAAHDGARLVGTLRLWPVQAGLGRAALLLGPLAVAESHREAGLGGALMREGLARARARNHRAVILVGDAPYYARFGFSHDLVANLAMPGPVETERFLGLELAAGALAGAIGRVFAAGERASRTASDATRRISRAA